MGCYHLCEHWTLARSAVPTQHLLFGLSTTSSPASAFFNVPSNEGIDPFSPETWSSFLVCRRRDVVVTFFLHEEKEVEMMPPAGRAAGTAFLPLSSCFTSWDTWHGKWAPGLANALQFTCVSGSVESIIYFSCRPSYTFIVDQGDEFVFWCQNKSGDSNVNTLVFMWDFFLRYVL